VNQNINLQPVSSVVLDNILVNDESYAQQIMKQIDSVGYSLVYLCSPTNPSFLELSTAAVSAFNEIWSNNLDGGLGGRVDKASINFDAVANADSNLVELLNASVIPNILRSKLGKKIYFDKNFSKFRGVNPSIKEQVNYSPLHYDGEFLPGPTYNLCIPFTGYGGPFPGLDLWKYPKWHSYLRFLIGSKLYKSIVSKFTAKWEPIVPPGYVLMFNENVMHQRSIFKKHLPRINVEFRFFSENEIGNNDLCLTEF